MNIGKYGKNGKKELREGAFVGVLLADQFAKLFGLDLLVESGFRSIGNQMVLWKRRQAYEKKMGINTGNSRVAKPGFSDHNKAAGCDIVAYFAGTSTKCTRGANDSKSSKYQQIYADILVLCMNLAGWSWYVDEEWHFSYGTRRSNLVAAKMGVIDKSDVNKRAYGLVEEMPKGLTEDDDEKDHAHGHGDHAIA